MTPRAGRIPLAIPGLDVLLFPDQHGEDTVGFDTPTEHHVVPRLMLIKGAPGTGKSTLATQMMCEMLKANWNCLYLTTGAKKEVEATISLFGFLGRDAAGEFERRVDVREISADYDKLLNKPEK